MVIYNRDSVFYHDKIFPSSHYNYIFAVLSIWIATHKMYAENLIASMAVWGDKALWKRIVLWSRVPMNVFMEMD